MMSGGSMDYLYLTVMDAEFEETTPERKAFRDHLQKVAAALKAIEWNDSGDGADNEPELIRDCLANGDVLRAILDEAKAVQADLAAEINRLELFYG